MYPIQPAVAATSTPSGSGAASCRASSLRTRSSPTWGPFPCTTQRFHPSSARSTTGPRLSRVWRNWSAMVDRSPAGESALPPSAITAVARCCAVGSVTVIAAASYLSPGTRARSWPALFDERAERIVGASEGHPVPVLQRPTHLLVERCDLGAEIARMHGRAIRVHAACGPECLGERCSRAQRRVGGGGDPRDARHVIGTPGVRRLHDRRSACER